MNRQYHYDADAGELFTTLEGVPESTLALAVTFDSHPVDEVTNDLTFLAEAGNIHAELIKALAGMLSIEDSVTQGQERERRLEWVPKSRALLKAVQS